jgi:hypothetical protein
MRPIEIIRGRGFLFTEFKGTLRLTFLEEPKEPREELSHYAFGWCDSLAAWVRLGGETGREVAKSLARSWLAAEDCPEDEMPDPSADIIESDAESEAVNQALDEGGKRFYSSEQPYGATLADLVAANAHDEDVIEWIATHVNFLAVGESCEYGGGACAVTTITRRE